MENNELKKYEILLFKKVALHMIFSILCKSQN